MCICWFQLFNTYFHSFFIYNSLQRPATRVFLLACRYEFVKSISKSGDSNRRCTYILVTYILWMIISSIRCELRDPGSFSPILNDRQSRISTYRFYTLNSQRSEKTQLTQDMYIFCFILYTIRNKNTRKVSCMKVHWSLSLGL